MPKFYFHLRNGADVLIDHNGSDMTIEAAIARAMIEARALIADDVMQGRIDLRQRIDVEDANGTVVHAVPFSDAIRVIKASG